MPRIYFATNRNPINPGPANRPTDYGNTLSQHGLADLRFGWADRAANGRITVVTAAEDLGQGPTGTPVVGSMSAQKLGSEEVFSKIRKEMSNNKIDCMAYIHGFNFTFREALERTFELKTFYAARDMVWIVFSWPSDGQMIPLKSYYSDRYDAMASAAALARGLQKMAHYLRELPPADYCQQSLHLMAHSMGNYALRHAIQRIRTSGTSLLRRLFDEILLLAADEDDDAFELDYKLKPLPEMAKRVSIYINPADRALVISDKTKQNPDRLGAGGPQRVWEIPTKVSVIDCENATGGKPDATRHQYYRLSTKVRNDILQVLAGKASEAISGRSFVSEKNLYRL